VVICHDRLVVVVVHPSVVIPVVGQGEDTAHVSADEWDGENVQLNVVLFGILDGFVETLQPARSVIKATSISATLVWRKRLTSSSR